MRAIQTGLTEISGANQSEAAVSIIRCSAPLDSILLLRRKKTISDPWSGHFAFPGGKRDPEDDSIFETCLRETREETGIILDRACLSRRLPAALAGRNVQASIQVQPFLFSLPQRPRVVVETSEIENYLWLDTDKFVNKNRHVVEEVLPSRFYPVYPLEDYYIWGFTYGLLCSILELHGA